MMLCAIYDDIEALQSVIAGIEDRSGVWRLIAMDLLGIAVESHMRHYGSHADQAAEPIITALIMAAFDEDGGPS